MQTTLIKGTELYETFKLVLGFGTHCVTDTLPNYSTTAGRVSKDNLI